MGSGVAVLSSGISDNLDPVVTGYFRSTATFGDLTLTSAGSNDGFVAALVSCPSLFCIPGAVEPLLEGQIAVLAPATPNPTRTTTTLTLTLARAEYVTVEVFDLTGRRLALLHDGWFPAGSHPLAFDPSGLPAGVYIIHAAGESLHASRRVLVLR